VGRRVLRGRAWLDPVLSSASRGCGKSTGGRAILRLFDFTAGQVVLDGHRIDDLHAGSLRSHAPSALQVVFQILTQASILGCACRASLPTIRNFGLAKLSAELEARSRLMSTGAPASDALKPPAHNSACGSASAHLHCPGHWRRNPN